MEEKLAVQISLAEMERKISKFLFLVQKFDALDSKDFPFLFYKTKTGSFVRFSYIYLLIVLIKCGPVE